MAEPEIQVVIEDDGDAVTHDPISDTITTKTPDVGVVVQLNAGLSADAPAVGNFDENLADKIGPMELGVIANDLLDAIDTDNNSRQTWLNNTAAGMRLLGLEVESSNSDAGSSSAPIEGMSTVKSPLLMEAILRGWANSVGELLPAAGPVKIEDEKPVVASQPGVQAPPDQRDNLAEALQSDMNRYLTTVATEFYPETSTMLLWEVHFKGIGIKKIYRCPMRRRPVSESVPIQDFIVSNAAKDLRSCARITHQSQVRPSVMKRMMKLGAYRDVTLTQPSTDNNVVNQGIAAIQGTMPQDRPEDQPYNIYETQCELDLDQFAPNDFKGSGIPLPYLVTIDKDSREILSIRRDWDEEDPQAERKRLYVKYPYVPGPGFYGTGLLGILGNSSAAMTAAWREALDAGQFASFPGYLYAKMAGRQLTNEFRVGPGQGIAIEVPAGSKLDDMVSALPYKDVTPGLMAMIDKISTAAKALGNTAELPIGEGAADIPVGTMIALIEQATKVMAATHKGMHGALAEEIQIMVDLFRKNPEDFWRYNRKSATQWDEASFLNALSDCYLVPVSDPNVPSHMHRVAKNMALAQLAGTPNFGPLMNQREVLERIIRDALHENTDGLVLPPAPPGAPPIDPIKMAEAQAKAKTAEANMLKAQTAVQGDAADRSLKLQEIQGRVAVSQNQEDTARIIHQSDDQRQVRSQQVDEKEKGLNALVKVQELGLKKRELDHKERQGHHDRAMDVFNSTKPEKE